MDRLLELRTAESVAFSYELAGVGSRFLAYFIDLCIQLAFTLAIFLGAVILLSTKPLTAGAAMRHVNETSHAVVVALLIAAVFLVYFGYFAILEAAWNGRTVGKRLVGLRVVRDRGYPLDPLAAIIRNTIRFLEFALGFYAISVVSALLSKENKRLGDFVAGTIVIRDRALPVVDEARWLREQTVAADASIPAEDRALVERYLARRHGLAGAHRKEIAHRIAERLRIVAPEMAALDDEQLIDAIARLSNG